MQRTARLVLWRARPPFRKVVAVQRITLGGFLALLRTVAPKVAAAMQEAGRGLTDLELIHAPGVATQETVAAFADLIALDQSAGFMVPWLDGRFGGAFARRNTDALLAASRAAEGDGAWTRFLGTLNRAPAAPTPGAKKARGGGLAADRDDVARIWGVGPWVIEQLPLQTFLDYCDAINRRMDEADEEQLLGDPLMDPNAEPTPLPKRTVH